MHWNNVAYDEHSCAMPIGIVLTINIVVQCIEIALLMINIVVQCNRKIINVLYCIM